MVEVDTDTEDCAKPCTGLIVTSFLKTNQNKNLENHLSVFQAYNDYKKASQYPLGYTGNFF